MYEARTFFYARLQKEIKRVALNPTGCISHSNAYAIKIYMRKAYQSLIFEFTINLRMRGV